MKIYTKKGDHGDTGVLGGPRVRKDDLRIEAYGTVDELNSTLGLVRASGPPADMDATLRRIQHELFAVGSELASINPFEFQTDIVGADHTVLLEREIDRYDAELPPLRQFILPAGTPLAAALHMARTVCRRAERRVVTLTYAHEGPASPRLVTYLNRLGDLLFMMCRAANAVAGIPDEAWVKPARSKDE